MRTNMLKSERSAVAAQSARRSLSDRTRWRIGVLYPSVPITTLASTRSLASIQPQKRESAALVRMALVLPFVFATCRINLAISPRRISRTGLACNDAA